MDIIIKNTNKTATLEIIDPKTGVDYIADFIGNEGALNDGQFTYDDGAGAWICDQDTFDWWHGIVTDHQALRYRTDELIKKHGSDKVYAALDGVGNCDLEDHARLANEALDAWLGDL